MNSARFKVYAHRASSVSGSVKCQPSPLTCMVMLGNGSGTDFQASPLTCIIECWRLTLTLLLPLPLDARCAYTLSQVLSVTELIVSGTQCISFTQRNLFVVTELVVSGTQCISFTQSNLFVVTELVVSRNNCTFRIRLGSLKYHTQWRI